MINRETDRWQIGRYRYKWLFLIWFWWNTGGLCQGGASVSDMDMFQISSVISDQWAVGHGEHWGPIICLSALAGMAGPQGDARRGSVPTQCSPGIPHPSRRGTAPLPLGSTEQLWGPEVTGVANIPAASLELQSTSSLITLCLKGGVTERHVSRLAFVKKPPCFQFELTWTLFLCGYEIY